MFLKFSSACICTKCSCKTRKRYKNYLYYKIATHWKIIRNNGKTLHFYQIVSFLRHLKTCYNRCLKNLCAFFTSINIYFVVSQ